MFLITGCGRSGTGYTATLFLAACLEVGHERPRPDGCVSWPFAVEDRKYPVYHGQYRPHFDTVLHQVREPLATIASITTFRPDSWRWAGRHIKIDAEWSKLRKAAEYWLQWNELCEKQAAFTYRVEAIADAWAGICQECGVKAKFHDNVSTRINHRPHHTFTWQDIESATPNADAIKAMAERYGYL